MDADLKNLMQDGLHLFRQQMETQTKLLEVVVAQLSKPQSSIVLRSTPAMPVLAPAMLPFTTVDVTDPLYEGLIPLEAPRSGGWPHVRALHLEGENTCVACGTKNSLAVHHIFPFHIWPSLELEPLNLITLCAYHHLTLGHYMSWKAYNPYVRPMAIKTRENMIQRPMAAEGWTLNRIHAHLTANAS